MKWAFLKQALTKSWFFIVAKELFPTLPTNTMIIEDDHYDYDYNYKLQ